MGQLSYADTPANVRDDLEAAHARTWGELAAPGTWLTGTERVAVARHSRAARSCSLCARKKAALSPYGESGRHDGGGDLPSAVIEAIHRITTDPGRLSRRLLDDVVAEGADDTTFIEVLGVVAQTVAIDTFCRTIGVPCHDLPLPEVGEATRQRPPQTEDIGAWVPVLQLASPEGRDLYASSRRVANVGRALSLVPNATRAQLRLGQAQYVRGSDVATTASGGRAISRPQIELVAARVATLNECYY